jgi:hypothetical protein
MAEDNSKQQVVFSLMSAWGAKDGPAAAQWLVNNITNADTRTSAAETLADAWAENDPADATNWGFEYFTKTNDSNALQAALSHWVEQDVQSAEAFVEKLPDGDTRNVAFTDLAYHWAEKDPNASLAWAASIPDSTLRGQAQVEAFDSWSQWEPSKAAAAAGSLDPDTQADADRVIMSAWVNSDAVGASQWLGNLTAGQGKDNAILEFSTGIISNDPTSAMNWAQQIQDQDVRNSQLQDLGQQWINSDAATAVPWIQQSNLPDSVKRQILQNHGNGTDQSADSAPASN